MSSEEPLTPPPEKHPRNALRIAIISLVLVWTFFYNLLIKGEGLSSSFFHILDTISDDFVMGAALTILVGVAIVFVFSATKLYTQVITSRNSFRQLEDLFYKDFRPGRFKRFAKRLLYFEDLPEPDSACPVRVSSALLAICLVYTMSMLYVILFSEALFFVSWSAGVNLVIGDDASKLYTLPTLALAIPFSARVMAYMRYPYAQDFADFMPGALFVLLIVASLGFLFGSPDQKFFLVQVWGNEQYRLDFLRNGVFLAFIPVFFESAFWLLELSRMEDAEAAEAAETGEGSGPNQS